ncbi:MAG: ABC transporter ATP-binding protein [Epulopiscium sp.]|nr:ABC transporter ATP-binding protein [Candidatus Epulonipiscium sp.]
MIKIIKELKPFTLSVMVIIALLFMQAITELALPDYMSNIVNVGIQQNGIENTAPRVIRVREMDKIKLFLNDEERTIIDENYKVISKSTLKGKDYNLYIKKYPILRKDDLYVLNPSSKDTIEALASFLSKPMLIVETIEKGVFSEKMSLPEGADPFVALSKLSQEQVDIIKTKANEQFKSLPESMISQGATNYIKSEYEAIGININKLQSNYILSIGGIMLLISLLSMGAAISVGFLSARTSAGLGKNLRDKVFKKVTTFSNSEFDDFSTASLITRSTNDIQQVQMFTVMLLRMVFYAPIIGIGGVIRALRTNTSMAWIVGVGVLAILTLVILLFSVTMPKFKILQKLVDKVNRVMRESLNGMLVIRAFNTQKIEENKFDKANKNLTKTNLFVSRMMTFMMPTMMFIMNGIILLIIWVGAHEIENGTIQVGDMMAFMQYSMQIIMAFLMISLVSIILPRASVSAQRISEVLDKNTLINDPENPMKVTGNKGLLEFRNVSFRYPNAEECVLQDISFVAKPGQTTAFIGSTGSGKSTLINLIPRFYDVTKGEILLNGVDIRHMKLHDIRERIGYVPQKSILFSGTIESNLKYGKNANVEDEAIKRAIRIAQAKEFIDTKEEGFSSEISQGGTNVSGGQRQRLSIARALAKSPELFIFDDSFSALDFRTDATLRKAMKEELKDRTILIVAQRINTIRNAENIIVLDEGKVVGMGSHKELLKTCDVYKQIALSQLSEEELAI